MPATDHEGLWAIPASRHEAACASGSIATLAAVSDLRSGAYESALVIGVELEKTVPGNIAARHLNATFSWPSVFSQIDGANTFGTLNFGGSTATIVSFVVTRGSAA